MIKFFKGLRAKYTYPTNTELTDAIFFATDTGELLVNGVNYGVDTQKVKDVEFDGNTNTFTFTKGDGTTVSANLGDKLLTDSDKQALESVKEILESGNLSVTYIPGVSDSIAMVEKVGGLKAGTTAGSLKNKTISAVLDDMLFPTVQPTAVEPKATLALKSGKPNIREVGSASPVLADFTTTWNAGQIKIGNDVQATRAGEKTAEIVYANTEGNAVTAEAGTVSLGTTNYYYKVTYSAGPAPKDSKGNPAETLTALPAGYKVSSAVPVYGVYPFFATTTAENITNQTVSKLPLTNSASFTCTLSAESATSKHVIKIPHTVTKIELKDPFGNWANQPLEEFVKTSESINVNGTSVSYNVYTRNQGQNGATEFRITYTK